MKRTSLRPPAELPSVFVSGKRVLRATTMEVVLAAEPPWTEIPPAWGPVRPKRLARARVVVFSMMVRAGETW